MASFPNAIKLGFQRYFDFSGRSTRSDYWWWFLFAWTTSMILRIVDNIAGMMITPTLGILGTLFGLAVFIPTIAIAFRRLHDINRSAWWFLLHLGVGIGSIVLIVWHCRRGDEGQNKYGNPP